MIRPFLIPDGNGIQDYIVKFNRLEVIELFEGIELPADLEIKIIGELTDGTPFTGTDIIRVIWPGRGGSQIGHPEDIPARLSIVQISPNPFYKSANIRYSIPEQTRVTLTLYDLSGRVVKILENRVMQPGYYSHVLECNKLISGVYFIRLNAGKHRAVKKVVFMK